MIGRARFAFTVLAFGYAFLYLPIALVIVYSFNDSRLVTVWAGFSTQMVAGAVRERGDARRPPGCRCASPCVSATLAALLGLAAGYVLARVPRFFGRTLFGSLVIAPMVMPEVVMGISMLLLFVGSEQLLGGPDRGFLTIAIAPHHLLDRLRGHRGAGAARRFRPLARGGGDGSRRHAVDHLPRR